MKIILTTFFATCLFASVSEGAAPVAPRRDAASPPSAAQEDARRFQYYVGANARWIIDLRLNVVSAWDRSLDVPLWSRDGVVFRVFQRPNDVKTDFKAATAQPPVPAPEFFGRVYFFLDGVLVALDPRAQGRLVWKLYVEELTRFFSAPKNADLNAISGSSPALDQDAKSPVFLPKLRSLTDDRLLVQTRRGQELKTFVVDAASGEFRPAQPDEEASIQR